MDSIFNRRSTRKYINIDLTKEQIEKILKAGMAAPSAGNGQEWEFIVFKNKETKDKLMEVHKFAKALETAPVAILVCGNKEKEAYKGTDWWIQDCSASMENMIIEATFLGLGSLWLGIHPYEERIEKVKEIFELPECVRPLGIVVLGVIENKKKPIDRYLKDSVHYEKYGRLYK